MARSARVGRGSLVLLVLLGACGAVRAEDAPAGRTIEGRVVSAAGEALAGARIEVSAFALPAHPALWTPDPWDLPRVPPDPTRALVPAPEAEPIARVEVVADAAGRFTIPAPASRAWLRLVLLEEEWLAEGGASPVTREPVVLTAVPARLVRLEVEGTEGQPAWVHFYPLAEAPPAPGPPAGPLAARYPFRPARTDARGRLTVRLPRGVRWIAAVCVPGRYCVGVDVPGTDADVPLVLRPLAGPGRLCVRVTDSKGRPVAGAEVRAAIHHAEPGRPWQVAPHLQNSALGARTDADGGARLEGFRPGMLHQVQVHAEGLPDHAEHLAVPLLDATPCDLDVCLAPALAIHGRVVDGADRPLGGVRVRGEVQGDPWVGGAVATSAADGTFTLAPLGPGTYRVLARLAEHYALLVEPRPAPPTHARSFADPREGPGLVGLTERRSPAVLLRMLPAARLRVRLVSPEGDAVPGARVTGRWVPGPYPASVSDGVVQGEYAYQARELEPGTWLYSDLPARGHLDLQIHAPAHLPPPTARVDLGSGWRELEATLVCPPLRHVRGVVRDGRGEPVPGALVGLDLGAYYAQATDAAGRFAFAGVHPQATRVFLLADPGGGAALPAPEAAAAPPAEVELRLPAATRTLTVRALRRDGTPVAGHALTLELPLEQGAVAVQGVTDAAGAARFDQLPALALRLRASPARQPIDVAAEAAELTLDEEQLGLLPPGPEAGGARDAPTVHRLLGEVRLPDGRPVPRANVWLRGGVGGRANGFVRAGRFALEVTLPPPREEAAGGTGSPPTPPPIELHVSGASTACGRPLPVLGDSRALSRAELMGPIQIVLEPSAIVRGVLLDEAGAPLVGFPIWASRVEDRAPWSGPVADGPTDAHGRFAIVGLRPGEAVRVGVADPAPLAPAPAVVARGGEEVRLRLRPYRTLRGRVVDETGAPLGGTRVDLRITQGHPSPVRPGSPAHALAGPDGRFEIAGLAPGIPLGVTIQARGPTADDPGWFPFQQALEEVPEEPVDLVVWRRHDLRGRALTRSGAPWPLARVYLAPWALEDAPRGPDTRAVAGADGRFALGGLRRGVYLLRVEAPRAPGCAQAPAPVEQRIEVPGGPLTIRFPDPVPDLVTVVAAGGDGVPVEARFGPAGETDPPVAVRSGRRAHTPEGGEAFEVEVGPRTGTLWVRFAHGEVAVLEGVHARAEPWVAEPRRGHSVPGRLEGFPPGLEDQFRVVLRRGDLRMPLERGHGGVVSAPLPAGAYAVEVLGPVERLRGRLVHPATWDPAADAVLVVRYEAP